MKQIAISITAALFAMVAVAHADELNTSDRMAPQGLIVRKSEDGKVEVFKAATAGVRDDKSALAAIGSFVKAENKISKMKPISELDRVSSDESWYYWYNYSYNYWNYGCNYRGYYYNYYAYYSYYRSGYSYYYYRY